MLRNGIFFKELKQSDCFRWAAFCFIALAVLIAYFPSLYYPPRADQVIYLSETSAIQHPWDLIIGCYDHNRHRTIAPGDEFLFRPLLYAFLGSEQVLFGHHFWAWQLTGILAHLLLIWVLLRLLWHLSRPWLAFAGAWLFALSVFNYEMVTWPHLSSYMLMMACMVAAIEQAVFCLEVGQIPRERCLRMFIYFLIACFIYETANIFVLLIVGGLFIAFPRMKRSLALLLTPVLLYAFASYFNYTCMDHLSYHAAKSAQTIAWWKYVLAVLHLSFWWLYEGLFNGAYHYFFAIRTMFLENEVMVFKPLLLNDPQIFLQIFILGSFLGLAWVSRRHFFKNIRFLVVLLGMLLSYVAVIVVGRHREMGNLWATVGVNSYFSYIFWVIVVLLSFVLIAAKEVKTKRHRSLIIVFVTASLLSGLWQAKKLHDMTVHYSNAANNVVVLITTLDLLIQEKGSEPGFSFYVDAFYPGNYPYTGVRKAADPLTREYTFAEFLYPHYFRPRAEAKYKFLTKNPQ